jgi:hypothetical protein
MTCVVMTGEVAPLECNLDALAVIYESLNGLWLVLS